MQAGGSSHRTLHSCSCKYSVYFTCTKDNENIYFLKILYRPSCPCSKCLSSLFFLFFYCISYDMKCVVNKHLEAGWRNAAQSLYSLILLQRIYIFLEEIKEFGANDGFGHNSRTWRRLNSKVNQCRRVLDLNL